jgi:tyrosyl-tRNA synthetase
MVSSRQPNHIAQGLLRAITVNKLTSAGIHFKFWVADWFAMLNNKLGGDLEKIRIVGDYFIEVWKACGMDLENVEFIWASQFIKEHPNTGKQSSNSLRKHLYSESSVAAKSWDAKKV